MTRRIVLDVLPNRKKVTLISWFECPPDGIDLSCLAFVATDLWAHYRAAVHEVFPNVSVVADRFHVVQNLHSVIHEARRGFQKGAKDEEERGQLKGLRFLLLKNEAKLTNSDKERLKELSSFQPRLFRLWQLRQELHDWYEKNTSADEACADLKKWKADAKKLDIKDLDKFCDTLTTWEAEITNFFHHRITSGFVEGMNSKIRVLKRIAFGIPNLEHFRLRIIAFCG